jgi:hypothetical protein
MVDMREMLPDGTRNPNFRKYVQFDLWADVTLAYFELFRANEGNLDKTWRQIEAEGPGYPEVTEDMIPDGFLWRKYIDNYSPVTGQLVPSSCGLRYLLTNVAYIGHWIHKQVIVCWNNHEAIIPLDLFMYAYNRISPTDFQGDPNPNYVPYRPWVRHYKADRQVEPPTYADLIYSDDLPEYPNHRLAAVWNTWAEEYQYQLYMQPYKSNLWNIKARNVDAIVDRLLLERLKAATIDETAWQTALESLDSGDQSEARRIEAAIRAAKQTKDNLIASLTTLTHPEMVQRAQARFESADGEIAMLTAELESVQAKRPHSLAVVQVRPALEKVIAHWDKVPRPEKRALFEGFATHIHITKISRASKRITTHWRDGSQSTYTTVRLSRGFFWESEDLENLRQMIDTNVDQVEILRTYPAYTWRALLERYAYNFGNGKRPQNYAGKRPYSNKVRWADTKEAKLGQLTQITPSGASTAIC